MVVTIRTKRAEQSNAVLDLAEFGTRSVDRRRVSALRRTGAIGLGMLQVVVGVVLAVLSIDSLALVSDGPFSLNWALAIPSMVLLATVGLTVARLTLDPRWLPIGAFSVLVAFGVALLGIAAFGSVAAGIAAFVIVQMLPAVVPNRSRATRTMQPSDERFDDGATPVGGWQPLCDR